MLKTTADDLLRRFDISPPHGEHADASGIALSLGGHVDDGGPKTLTLTSGTFSQSRSCPLGEDEAQNMVDRLRERHAIPSGHAEESTLKHLLVKCSQMYAESEITSFIMKPVYLLKGGYRIHDVAMFSAKHLKIVPRLASHAHEQGEVVPHRDGTRR